MGIICDAQPVSLACGSQAARRAQTASRQLMGRRRLKMRYLLAMMALFMFSVAALATDESREAVRLQKAAEVISEIMGTPEKGIPRDLLNKAVCVGVIPSEKKLA